MSAVKIVGSSRAELSSVGEATSPCLRRPSCFPEIVDLVAHHEEIRRNGFSQFVETLAERELLVPGTDLSEVTDVFLTVLGSAFHLDFTQGRGWSVDRDAAWASSTALHIRTP